jgi:hypothetical protein
MIDQKQLPSSNPDADVDAVVEAVRKYDPTKTKSWDDVRILSDKTELDGLDLDPAGIILQPGNEFKGIVNIYVVLTYGRKKNDTFMTSDSFLGYFKGHFDKEHRPIIDDLLIDTSPFYEGENV